MRKFKNWLRQLEWYLFEEAYLNFESEFPLKQDIISCFKVYQDLKKITDRSKALFSAFGVLMIVLWSFLRYHGLRPDWFLYLTCAFVAGAVVLLLMQAESFRLYIARYSVRRRKKLLLRSYPITAEKLLDLFSPPETAWEVVADTNAQFEKRRARYGLAHARRWYWWQVLRSVSCGIKEIIELALKVSGK